MYTNDHASASPAVFFFLYQLRVNGIVSVSSNRVHVYKKCVNVTALLLTMTQKHSRVTRVGMGRTVETVRFQSEDVVPFPH